ncbi:hypothetical protein [Vibrio taketomensis]|uniref:hypothetical protein n=1 Tax=Vibrio taketomensis TaxID=2572923 RepID=UPI002F96CE9E
MLACCLLIISDIPLVVTAYLLIQLVFTYRRDGLLAASLVGDIAVYSDGRVQTELSCYTYRRAWLVFSELVIILSVHRGWHFIWRDSVDEEHYWQLLMLLKKEP